MIIGFGISPSRVKASSGVSYDADAQAFFTAASITDATQKNAVNQLVLDLKSYNIWTKCLAIYPICGGSASSHAVNLKTPGTYNLTFSTGWSHASTGMTPNGSAYANPALAGNENSNHFSIYSRTNIEQSSNDIGCRTGSSISSIAPRVATNTAYFQNYNTAFISFTNSDSRGFYCNTRTASNSYKAFVNGISKGSATDSGVSNNYSFYIGARNNLNSAENYSTRQLAFASIGDGLTDTESANFYTAVQAYQTTLSRQV